MFCCPERPVSSLRLYVCSRPVNESVDTGSTSVPVYVDGHVLQTCAVVYPNGYMVKKVTACRYERLESDAEMNACVTYCPQADLLCPSPDPTYKTPDCLKKRGLQVGCADTVVPGCISHAWWDNSYSFADSS